MQPVPAIAFSTPSPLARALAAAALLAGTAAAQSLLVESTGVGLDELHGSSIARLGDVDGDGKADYAVGAPWDDFLAPEAGSVRIFSGASGVLLGYLWGQGTGDWFGYSVANAGDVNADGTDDLIVGAPKGYVLGAGRTGEVFVYDPKTGALLQSWHGDSAGDDFGFSVAGGIDGNQDGRPDLLVGAPRDDDNGMESGSVRAFSGMTGTILTTFKGASAGDSFGFSVAVVGDATGDGFPDFAIGAKDALWFSTVRAGRVDVYDGVTGSPLWGTWGAVHGDEMGYAVAGGLDANLDGLADVIVAAPGNDAVGLDAGNVQLRSGIDGTVLAFSSGDGAGHRFGTAVAGLGDLNNDGRADFAAAAHQALTNGVGYVKVCSGATSALIFRLLGEQGGEGFGSAMAGLGDVNGDVKPDLVVGAPYYDVGATTGAGAARVFSGASLQPTPYCGSKLNSAGCYPWMGWNGMPHSGSAVFTLYAANVLNQRPGTLIYGMDEVATPFQGGTLCVRAPVARLPMAWSGGDTNGTNCTGNLSFDVKSWIASGVDPRLQPGRTVYAQVWFRDGAASYGSGLSNAVRFGIAP